MACWSQLVWRALLDERPPLLLPSPPLLRRLLPSPPSLPPPCHPSHPVHLHRGLNSIIKNDHQRAHCKQICSRWRLAHKHRSRRGAFCSHVLRQCACFTWSSPPHPTPPHHRSPPLPSSTPPFFFFLFLPLPPTLCLCSFWTLEYDWRLFDVTAAALGDCREAAEGHLSPDEEPHFLRRPLPRLSEAARAV